MVACLVAGAQLGLKLFMAQKKTHLPLKSLRTTTADYRDETALTHFLNRGCGDMVENVPQETANPLSQFVPVRPPVRASTPLKPDRKLPYRVRTFSGRLSEHQTEDLQEVHARFDGQGIIKTRRFDSDGKGQWRMTPETDLKVFLNEMTTVQLSVRHLFHLMARFRLWRLVAHQDR